MVISLSHIRCFSRSVSLSLSLCLSRSLCVRVCLKDDMWMDEVTPCFVLFYFVLFFVVVRCLFVLLLIGGDRLDKVVVV